VRKLLLVLLILSPFALLAQEDSTSYEYYDEEAEEEVIVVNPESLNSLKEYKTKKITLRKFDDEKWKAIIGTTNFEEEEEKPKETSQGSIPWNSGILKIISYVLLFAILGAIVYFIVQNTSVGSKKIKKVQPANDLTSTVEDIEAIDLKTMLERALAGSDLRLVIRVYYLTLLHKLHESGNIVWKKNKTNLDYLLELLTKGSYYDEVRHLTRAYETVWYGEQPITAAVYDQLVADFKKINQQLSFPKPA
jgi:hypothetical protein